MENKKEKEQGKEKFEGCACQILGNGWVVSWYIEKVKDMGIRRSPRDFEQMGFLLVYCPLHNVPYSTYINSSVGPPLKYVISFDAGSRRRPKGITNGVLSSAVRRYSGIITSEFSTN